MYLYLHITYTYLYDKSQFTMVVIHQLRGFRPSSGWWTSVVEVIRICSMWRKPEVLWLTPKLGKRILKDQKVTLWETNIAPENRPLEKEIPIGNHHLWAMLVYRRVQQISFMGSNWRFKVDSRSRCLWMWPLRLEMFVNVISLVTSVDVAPLPELWKATEARWSKLFFL